MRECFEQAAQQGGERNSELRAIPAGVGRAGVRGPAAEPHRQAVARVGAAAGEDDGELRS